MSINRITPESVAAQTARPARPADDSAPSAPVSAASQAPFRVTITAEARTRAAEAATSGTSLSAQEIASHRQDVANGVYDSPDMIDAIARRLVTGREVLPLFRDRRFQ